MTSNSLIDQISEAADYQREQGEKIGKEIIGIFSVINVFLVSCIIYLALLNVISLFFTIPGLIVIDLIFHVIYKIQNLRRVEESIPYTSLLVLETIRLYKHDEILSDVLDTITDKDLRYEEGKELLKEIKSSFNTQITELLKNRKIKKNNYIDYEN